MTKDLSNAVTVPVDECGYIGYCLQNAEYQVAQQGGSVVYGWQITEGACYYEILHHVIWRSPDGELIDVTPHMLGATEIRFLADKSATTRGEKPFRLMRPTLYLPKKTSKRAAEGCRALFMSGQAIWNGDEAAAIRWTRKAEECFSKAYGGRVTIQNPIMQGFVAV